MKKEIINIIKILGIDFKELVIDMAIGDIVYNSIEIIDPDTVILHYFYDDLDIETIWEDISDSDKKKVLKILKPLLYN